MVSQKLPQCLLYALFRFIALFSPNTSSMDTIRQWCLEDEGVVMVGRQKSHHVLLTSIPLHPMSLTGNHFSPCRSPHSLFPCLLVKRGPGDLIGSLALSTPHRCGTITELTMLQVTQGPSVIIPKTDGRLRRNSLLVQGTRDCVATFKVGLR